MLASNSVVFMPIPRYETLVEESALEVRLLDYIINDGITQTADSFHTLCDPQPYVHFVPVEQDFSDLLRQIEWCESRWSDCYAISQRSTAYVRWVTK